MRWVWSILAGGCMAVIHMIGLAAEPARPFLDPVPGKIVRYAGQLLRTYDKNGDGRLQPEEWRRMRGNPRLADADGDGMITEDELAHYIADYGQRHKFHLAVPPGVAEKVASPFTPAAELEPNPPTRSETKATTGKDLQNGSAGTKRARARPKAKTAATGPATVAADKASPGKETAVDTESTDEAAPEATKFHVPASRLPPGLPTWFFARDLDGDGQLTLAEFAPKPTRALIEEFNQLDANHDGILTAHEVLQGLKATKTTKSARKKD